jgi:hypothetical protein
MNAVEPGELTFKERVERVAQFGKMLINLGIHLERDNDVNNARESYKRLLKFML